MLHVQCVVFEKYTPTAVFSLYPSQNVCMTKLLVYCPLKNLLCNVHTPMLQVLLSFAVLCVDKLFVQIYLNPHQY